MNPESGQESLMHTIVEHIPAMVFLKRATDLRFTYMNAAGEKLLGLARADLIEKNDYDFFPQDQADFFTHKDREVLDNRLLLDIASEPIKTVGGTRYLHTKKITLVDQNNTPNYLLGISVDITDRVKAEQKAHELAAIVASSNDAIVAMESNGIVRSVNIAAEKLLGIKDTETIGQHIESVWPPARNKIRKLISKALEHKIHIQDELQWIDGNNETKFVSLDVWTVDWIQMDERKSSVFLAARDITTSRRNAEMIAEQQRALVNASKLSSLGEMAGGIAHEINNPLAVIDGYSHRLAVEAASGNMTPERVIATAEKISAMVNRITKIVLGLRAFARDGRQDPFQSTPLKEILENTLDLCRAKLANLGIELRLSGFEVSFSIDCRAVQICQVLMNLVSNAIDAVQDQSPAWIALTVEKQAEFVRLTVRDNGKKITDEVAEKIFEPFFTTKEPGKGTGLGLSISKGIIDSHNGKLFHDKLAEHTSFVVEIPITQTL